MSSASGRRLPPLPALRDFIHLYSLRAKKILSQNYLMDMNLTRKIVRHAGVQPGGVAAEVGPGPGGISRAILEAGVERLDVVEIDSRFIPSLQHLSEAAEDRLHIHRADILKTCIGHIWRAAGVGGACDRATDEPLCGDAQEMRFSKHFRPWLEDSPELNIIGNLPFNIATPLIIKFIREISYRAGPWSFGRVPLTLTFQVVEKFVRQVFHYRQKYIVKGLMTLYPDGMAKDAAHEVIREVRVSPTTTSIRVGLEEYAEMGAVYERHCREHPGLFLYDYTKPAKGGLAELATKKNAVPVPYPFQSYQLPPEGVSLHQFDVLLKQGLIS